MNRALPGPEDNLCSWLKFKDSDWFVEAFCNHAIVCHGRVHEGGHRHWHCSICRLGQGGHAACLVDVTEHVHAWLLISDILKQVLTTMACIQHTTGRIMRHEDVNARWDGPASTAVPWAAIDLKAGNLHELIVQVANAWEQPLSILCPELAKDAYVMVSSDHKLLRMRQAVKEGCKGLDLSLRAILREVAAMDKQVAWRHCVWRQRGLQAVRVAQADDSDWPRSDPLQGHSSHGDRRIS
mmetsp:Transcript_16061/g.33442  ORF Transcript_16061/g.33442 Transcript_16061/m.33442 type:complete len:239 (+) Transcript_16061:24-740(+)